MPTKKRGGSHDSEDGGDMARLLGSEEATQTIDLSSLLTRDITASGSFDIRGQIWSTTFGKLLQALPIPALLIDQSYAIAVTNQACARVTHTYEKLHGCDFRSLFPRPPTSATIAGLLEEIFLQRMTKVTEALMQIQNKTTWTRITLRPIRIVDSRFILAILEDLTAEKGQIALQIKHEKELQKAHDKLKGSLREKEILLREIHHRVNNNLQLISSLLRLELLQAERKNESFGKVLEDIQGRIQAMALVHRALYRSENLGWIDVPGYVQSIVAGLHASSPRGIGELSVKTDLKNISLGINTALTCGLIINELVTNALKHAFPAGRRGEVVVSLESTGDAEVQLTVRDNGVGMPRDLDLQRPKSLGLELVRDLARQINGTVGFARGRGTEVRVRFGIS
jgi:two-component sensor histidine kinase